MAVIDLKTKPCPFCAETIQEAAVKCRFCGEFLNSKKAKALLANSDLDSEPSEQGQHADKVLFVGRPSIWGMAPAMVKGLFFLVVAWFLVTYPLEDMAVSFLGLRLAGSQALAVGRYRVIAGLGLAAIVTLVFLLEVLNLKMIYYEVTPDRIEWRRGILDRRVDNLDMFRVIDLKMRRSPLDCVFGIGTVALITTDKSDPQFVFKKMRDCRSLYDIIKRASLEADRRTGVVHLE